jgi:hypothetical protein
VGTNVEAYYTVTQVPPQGRTTACDPNYREIVSCKDRMPAICNIETLITKYPILNYKDPTSLAFGGAYPCGDCSNVVSGNTCNFVCGNGNEFKALDGDGRQVVVGAFSSIPCLDDGWPDFTDRAFALPQCQAMPLQCPNVLGIRVVSGNGVIDLGFTPEPQAQCVGATLTDKCIVSCSPSYYAPNNQFTATCVEFTNSDGQVYYDWTPWNDSDPLGHTKICQCQGCRYGISDNMGCECQIAPFLKPYRCFA